MPTPNDEQLYLDATQEVDRNDEADTSSLRIRKMTAWLMITTDDTVLHGAGYDDDPARYYSWDNTVGLHAKPSVGDAIVLWDKIRLLGAGVIDRMEEGRRDKSRYRCPTCSSTKLQGPRKRKKPLYWCPVCKAATDSPSEETVSVRTYRSYHEASWVDLYAVLDGKSLRNLCLKPKSQGSIRALDWDSFVAAITPRELCLTVNRFIRPIHQANSGGHRSQLVRTRIGQQSFRNTLLGTYKNTCALTGPAPSEVLDAAHLYSYAEHGYHDDLGGLLIRKDLHRLFDLGHLTVNPDSLTICVDEALFPYPDYKSLNGKRIAVSLRGRTKEWIKKHWALHHPDR